jgi:hypothetical protein
MIETISIIEIGVQQIFMMKEEELSVKTGNSWSSIILTTMHIKKLVNDSKTSKRAKKKKKGKVYIDGLGDELIELGNIKEEDNDFI